MKWKLTGEKKRMKKGVFPHIFDCEFNRKRLYGNFRKRARVPLQCDLIAKRKNSEEVLDTADTSQFIYVTEIMGINEYKNPVACLLEPKIEEKDEELDTNSKLLEKDEKPKRKGIFEPNIQKDEKPDINSIMFVQPKIEKGEEPQTNSILFVELKTKRNNEFEDERPKIVEKGEGKAKSVSIRQALL